VSSISKKKKIFFSHHIDMEIHTSSPVAKTEQTPEVEQNLEAPGDAFNDHEFDDEVSNENENTKDLTSHNQNDQIGLQYLAFIFANCFFTLFRQVWEAHCFRS
jgi:hypothetical protein